MSKSICAALAVATLGAISAPVFAAENVRETPIAITALNADEITVTVRKTEEQLSDVPLSVTALTANTLKNSTVQQLSDVALLTPGLTFLDFNVGALSTPVIRGLAQSNTQGRENNVGMFLDGVYLPSRNNIDLELLDLARVEVVKGPQSALYGRSTFAGTINYVTAAPSDEAELDLTASAGSDEYYEGRFRLSGPLSDTASGTLAFSHREFDGTVNNVASSDNLGGYDSNSIMGKLALEFSDNFSGTLMAFYTDKDIDSAGIYNAVNNCGTSFLGANYYCGNLQHRDDVDVDPNGKGAETQSTLLALELVYDFNDNLSLTSLTSYSDAQWDAITDYDANSNGVPYNILDAMMMPAGTENLNLLFFNTTDDTTVSQEFRLNGNSDNFSWLAGAFWTNEDFESTAANTLDSAPLAPGETISAGFLSGYLNSVLTSNPLVPNQLASQDAGKTDVWAVFGRGQWDFGAAGRLSVEARYTKEDKEVDGILSFGFPGSGLQSNDWSYFTPRVTYDYDLNEDIMLYGSVAQGTKSGGFNANYSAMFPDEAFFDEEKNTTYEVGSKGKLVDGRLQYDVAIFYIDWEDLQISGASQDPGFLTAIVRNTGSATSKGLELQASYAVTDWLAVGGGFAHADPEFDSGVVDLSLTSVCPGLCSTDVSGNQLGRTVKNQLNLYLDMSRQLSQDWDWYARADYIKRGGSPTRSANRQWVESRELVNARFGVQNERWDIAVWGKNIFDEGYVTSQIRQPQLNDFSRPTTVILGNGRQLALTVTYKMKP